MLFQPALRGPKKIHSFFIGIAEVKSLEEMSHMALEADNVCESLGFSLFYVFQTDSFCRLHAQLHQQVATGYKFLSELLNHSVNRSVQIH